MARDPQANSANYLEGAPFVTAAPFSFAAWVYPTSDAADSWVFLTSVAGGTTDNYWRCGLIGSVAGDPVRFYAFAGSSVGCSTTTGFVVNQWQRIMCVEYAADSRAVFISGGAKGTNAASRSPAGVNNLRIGRFASGNSFTGRIGPVTVWNAALTDEEVAADARGVIVRPQARIDYPMTGRIGEADARRLYPLSMVGTVLTNNGAATPASLPEQAARKIISLPPVLYAVAGAPPSGVTKAALILWAYEQGTVIAPPPPPPPKPTDQIFWNDSRIFHRESADRTFASHDSSLIVIGPNTVIGSTYRVNQIPAEGLIMTGGRNMFARVFEDPANEGVTRNWFKLRISNNCPIYSTNAQSIRIGVGGGYREIPVNTDVWQMTSFIFHDSLYADMGGRHNTSISGLHQPSSARQTLTPMTTIATPVGETGLQLLWRVRRWDPPDTPDPAGDPSPYHSNLPIIPLATARKRITLITRFRLGWNTGSGPHDPYHECYAQVNGAWLNNANPIYTHNGSRSGLSGRGVGFNLPGTLWRHESRGFALYNWANKFSPSTAWPDNANGDQVGFPSGDKCWMSWYRCAIVMYGGPGQSGEKPVNQHTLAAMANAASI